MQIIIDSDSEDEEVDIGNLNTTKNSSEINQNKN